MKKLCSCLIRKKEDELIKGENPFASRVPFDLMTQLLKLNPIFMFDFIIKESTRLNQITDQSSNSQIKIFPIGTS